MTQPQPDPSAVPVRLSRRAAVGRLAAGSLGLGAAVALGRRPASAQGNQDSATTEVAVRNAISQLNQALATGDVSLLSAAFAQTYVNHTPHRSPATGQLARPDLAGLTASLSELRGAVPDAVLITEEVIAAGDTAAVRLRFQGTLAASGSAGTPAASPSLNVGGVVIARVADGRVVESWDYAEAFALPNETGDAGAVAPASVVTSELVEAPAADPVAAGGQGEIRTVSDFTAVSLDGVGLMKLTQGDTESLSIEAEPHVLERIESVVEAGTLFIRPIASFDTDQPVVFHLSLRQLTDLTVAGAAQVEAPSLTTDALRLELSGSATTAIDRLAVTTLDVVAEGTTQLALAGTADQQTILLRDASHYTAPTLASRVVAVTVEAAAEATVAASEQLAAQVSGAGTIGYIGDPAVSQTVTEAGSLTKVG